MVINRKSNSVAKIMWQVNFALVPGILVASFAFGLIISWHILLAILAALITETCCLKLQKKKIIPTIIDGSAILTAILLALCLPVYAPWWSFCLGSFFALSLGKHVYGGLGQNIFNPAMVGYVILFVSIPTAMTKFSMPIWQLGNLDSVTGSTPLEISDAASKAFLPIKQNLQIFFWYIGELFWLSLAYAFGGLFLLIKKLINWRISVIFLITLCISNLIANQFVDNIIPWQVEILHSSTILAAFFIITDPVTAASSKTGQLIYGFGLGIITFFIRNFGNMADGIAFAILFMNSLVPFLDKIIIPSPFGNNR